MDDAPKSRRYFRFTLRQIVECVFWVAIGIMGVRACLAMSEEMLNSIWLFAWLLTGAPFGLAIGILFRHRLLGLAIGLVLPIAVGLAGAAVFGIWSGSWREI
jgi:hypothetical protein